MRFGETPSRDSAIVNAEIRREICTRRKDIRETFNKTLNDSNSIGIFA